MTFRVIAVWRTGLLGLLLGCQAENPRVSETTLTAAADAPEVLTTANAPSVAPGASDNTESTAAATPIARPTPGSTPELGAAPARFRLEVPGTQLTLDFVPLTAASGGTFWLSATEVPWEAFDVFLFGFDLPADQRVSGWDAASRPSRPYGSPDRGLGHRGFAAQAVTAHAAEGFCEWLGKLTGTPLRLPTESEWEWAAREGSARPPGCLDDLAPARRIPAELGQQVGFAPYDGPRPMALATLPDNPLGLRGLLGNVAEWVRRDSGKGHVTAGGSFLDGAEHCRPERREAQAASWNETDPQNPKSRWWLANAPSVGFRVLASSPPGKNL
jgi:formylglycine-generating enzyme required for sulfatase activity